MEKKNIYMIQANYLYGNDAYIPYAVGAIAAYAWHNEEIRTHYNLGRFVYLREDIEEAVHSFENPYLVAFSNYIWNYEYNKAFARRLKEIYPDCYVVFGGHNVSSKSPELLNACDYIDFLLHDEGEVPFEQLLLALKNNGDLADVCSLSYRDKDGKAVKNPNGVFSDIEDYPSPYLTGIFDEMVENSPYSFSVTIETNRGCPFRCAFCDWGKLKAKVRCFPMERIKGELLWMAKHKIEYCWCADANFGIFERDAEITDLFIETKNKYGYPQKLRVNFTKNSDEAVFQINKKLNDSNMSKGATLSFQSLSPVVLENIGRKNMTMEKFSNLMRLYNKENIPTYSEVILGLPGETYESFCGGIGKLLKAGQHTSINLFVCELLVNSIMGSKEYTEQFGIQTKQTPLVRYHTEPNARDITEISNIVVQTDTMNSAEWKKSVLFYLTVLAFHCLGPLQFFAMYLYSEQGKEYDVFYRDLIDWIEKNPKTICGEIYTDLKGRIDGILKNEGTWTYENPLFGKTMWPFEEGIFLQVVYHSDLFYRETEDFLRQFHIEKDLYDDLMRYQKNMIKVPGKNAFDIALSYDLNAYFSNIYINEYKPLQKTPNVLHVRDASSYDNWTDYAREVVMFGRRGGKNLYTDITKEML